MVLLDTNILVYAANISCEFHKVAFTLRDKVFTGEIKGCISLQNISEFYSVITSHKRVESPLSPSQAVEEIKKYFEAVRILKVHFNNRTVNILCDLAKKYQVRAQNIYDLRIVATMLDNGIGEIITANDSDFSKYCEIKTINPFKH